MYKRQWQHRPADAPEIISDDTARLIDGWWRAANYLSVGQIYLLDNPLLRRPLTRDDVKRRLLGHWGTTPGLNFLYAHFNRAITERNLDAVSYTHLDVYKRQISTAARSSGSTRPMWMS